MEKHLQSIEFTFENVEYHVIPAKYVKSLYIENLRKSLELQNDGSMRTIYTCTTLSMCFKRKETNQERTFAMKADGRPFPLGDRLVCCRDVTFITLNYDDETCLDIKVPWNFRSENHNENMLGALDEKHNKGSFIISRDEDILAHANFWPN